MRKRKKLFLKRYYLFIHERHTETQAEGERSRLPTGLDPRIPGSRPGLKADAQPLSHPGAPTSIFLKTGSNA